MCYWWFWRNCPSSYAILNIEVDDVPTFILVSLIIVITSIIGGVVSSIRAK